MSKYIKYAASKLIYKAPGVLNVEGYLINSSADTRYLTSLKLAVNRDENGQMIEIALGQYPNLNIAVEPGASMAVNFDITNVPHYTIADWEVNADYTVI